MPTASTKAQTEAKGSPSSIDLVQVRDVLMSLAQKQTHQSMVDVTMSVLSQASKAIDELTHENAQLKKALFGRRSEKVDPGQLSLFAQVLSTVVAADKADSQPSTPDTTDTPQSQPKRKGGKRRPLRPTQRHEIKVSDKQRPCPQCGQPRCTIGHVRSVVVEYTPAKIEVIEYLREKVACRPCQAEVTLAPGPAQRLIDGASPGPQMLAALTVNKAVDGLPLNRTQKRFARSGVDLPIQTLNRWEGFAHQLLLPLIERLRTHVQQADTINLDDTGLRVLQAKKKGGSFKGHIWVFVARRYDPGGDLQKTQELVFYTYAKTWEAHHPEQFLAGCTAVLQGDAYRGYERIASEYRGDAIGKLLAGCCMQLKWTPIFGPGAKLGWCSLPHRNGSRRDEEDPSETQSGVQGEGGPGGAARGGNGRAAVAAAQGPRQSDLQMEAAADEQHRARLRGRSCRQQRGVGARGGAAPENRGADGRTRFFVTRARSIAVTTRRALVQASARPSMRRQCELLGVSRSSLYYEPVAPDAEELALMRRMDELHLKRPFFGSRMMTRTLKLEGLEVNDLAPP
jgi:transposase